MKAESLIGTVLGTCTLQKIVGQGGMGAVFQAQQSRPRRQVAVKVLLPATSLTSSQKAAFLERFRRETDAAASLEHPNILPVHEYGEQDGLAYLVEPYISGGTLRDVMEQEGQMALPKVMNYLDQLAAALDFAHEHGVIHRDIKPANILITPEGRLLLTDFGLVKIVEGQSAHTRLTGAGAPVGTPDYMAPEQVMGKAVDGRSDLYSLGIILYQMVTGLTPFQGETPMQIAAQQLQTPPTSPRVLRADLPIPVEQVMLRALAKRPTERYAMCQDFAEAFYVALRSAGIYLDGSSSASLALGLGSSTSGRLYTPRGLFDPTWQTGTMGAMPVGSNELSKPTGVLPGTDAPTARPSGLLSRTGKFPHVSGTGQLPAATTSNLPASTAAGTFPAATGGQQAVLPPTVQQMSPATGALPVGLNQLSPVRNTTGSLRAQNSEQAAANTVKLTGPVKVVQVPVAGQPGRYVTGLLPVIAQTDELAELPASEQGHAKQQLKTVLLIALVLLLVLGPTVFWFVRLHSQTARQSSSTGVQILGTPDLKATAIAQLTATVEANQILSDPLRQNIHNFPVNKNEFFANGAYHIVDTNDNGVAVVLAEKPFSYPNAYSLTMEEIKGDDTTSSNSFGMIIRFSSITRGGKTIVTFYSFEVANTKGGEYQFWRYDNSKGSATNPWTQIWHQPFGSEFHQGQGARNINTFKVFENGSTFTFTINGKNIGTTHDGTLKSGTLGMLVNLKGTEIAFTNMLITHS